MRLLNEGHKFNVNLEGGHDFRQHIATMLILFCKVWSSHIKYGQDTGYLHNQAAFATNIVINED